MNVLPNSSFITTTNSSSINLIPSATSASTTYKQLPSTDSNTATNNQRPVIIKCAVCDEVLLNQGNNNDNKIISYRMLAVRPSIGSKEPFFPILETLTHTSAFHVPCCLMCSESLIEQWNDYEAKNVLIKNRIYNLPTANNKNKSQPNNMVIDNHQLNHNLSSPIINTTITVSCSNPPRILAHPISLSSNGNLILNSVSQTSTESNYSNSTTPSPQEEVLDLSMTGVNSSVVTSKTSDSSASKIELSILPTSTMTTLNLSTSNKSSTAVLNVSGTTGSRLRNSSTSDNNITINPYSLNSSMTNLIKVSSSPVQTLSLKSPFHHQNETTATVNNNTNNSPSPSLAKRPLLSCTLCDDQCPTLYSIMLRPMGNCPYFPSLTPYVKLNSIDSTGKISVCESCHHQLIVQWDAHQKTNKPILERQYQLVRCGGSIVASSKPHSSNVGSEILSTIVTTNNGNGVTNNLNRNHHQIPPISQSFVSIVAANKTFLCVMCGKDLITSSNHHHTSNNPQAISQNNSSSTTTPSLPSAHVAFSVSTENDTSGNVITKKLIVQSAQEINLLPFISSSSTTATTLHHQQQLLHENGRVLICSSCFESINSRCNNNNNNSHSNSNNSSSNNNDNCSSGGGNPTDHTIITKIAPNSKISSHDSLNGTITKAVVVTPATSIQYNSNSDGSIDQSSSIGNLLCLACNQHKSQYWVETKENSAKKPFFPFLHDPTEPINGRARLCAPCHLMLETQWDAYENSYVPYNQRVYRLPSTTNSQSTLQLTKRPPPSSTQQQLPSSSSSTGLNISSSSSLQVMNGQPTPPPPLKIQIAVPSSSSQTSIITGGNASSGVNHLHSSDHLLLTTVNQQQQQITNHQITTTSTITNDQRIFKLMNEFLTNLGGPHPILSGICTICQQHSAAGQTYQIFATSRNIILSTELGIYPYFPMLKHHQNSNSKKNSKNNSHLENPYIACTYCYHSLIAQWTAYHLSSKPEDRDLSTRHYNCRDFVCYVCGVTTYRQFVRSITVKDFPFLHEHKRPSGSLSLNKGESVVTCLTCYQTLTHQWIENERMKVPLEMRKYNWMAVPPPPPPSSSKNEPPPTTEQHKRHSVTVSADRTSTIIPILANTTLSYQLNSNSINHNGIISVPATGVVNEMIPKAIIVNTGSPVATAANNFTSAVIPSNNNDSATAKQASSVNLNVVAPTFNPSHTLAPLVAAAMAATPVTIKQEMSNSDSLMANNASTNNGQQQQPASTAPVVNITTGTKTGSFSNVLRHLARQQYVSIQYQKINDTQMSFQNPQQHESISNNSRTSSINLTTLASVAALAGSNRNNPSQFVSDANNITSHSIFNLVDHKHPPPPEHSSELPKAVINSNSFAIHFNALSNNSNNQNTNSGKLLKPKIEQNDQNCMSKKNSTTTIAIVNNTHPHHHHHHQRTQAKIRELEELVNDCHQEYDKSLSKVNMEVIKLRNKRIAHLNKLKENHLKLETTEIMDHQNSDSLSDEELTEIDCNHSNIESLNVFNINNHHSQRDSIVQFLDDVIPVLPLDKNDSRKLKFMSLLGLTTHQQKRERELDSFIQSKLNRRLSKASFKVDWFQENEDQILEADPELETFKFFAYCSPSDIIPNSDLLKVEQKRKYSPYKEDKDKIIKALDLVPSSKAEQLKTEIEWLSVLRNRQMRRKRRIVCIGKTYQNLSDQILNTWIPQLSSSLSSTLSSNSSSIDSELIKRFNKVIIPHLKEYANFDEAREELDDKSLNDKLSKKDDNHQKLSDKTVTIECNNNFSMNQHKTIIQTNHHQIQEKMKNDQCQNQQNVAINDNQTATNVTNNVMIVNTNPILNTHNKIINTKQFAQEFHESVLLETQKQITGKQIQNGGMGSNSSIVNIINTTGNHQLDHGTNLNQNHPMVLTTNAQHTIIYSDHLKPVVNSNITDSSSSPSLPSASAIHHQPHQQQHLLIDRNGLISTITTAPAAVITSIKVQDKVSIRDQILKLQHKINDLNREYQMWNEKKNEIIVTMQKLESEKTLYQLEVDRLSKCLDM